MTHSQEHIYRKNNESRHYLKRWDLLFFIFISLLYTSPCLAEGNSSPSHYGEGARGERLLDKSRECFAREDYDSALFYLNKVELLPPRSGRAGAGSNPELAAAIHEQYCLIFSALDDKQQSDYHRNMYLDVKEHAREDLSLEKRAEEILDKTQWLSVKITLLAIAIIALIIVFIHFKDKFSKDENSGERILRKRDYDAQDEELQEQIAVLQHKLRTSKEQNIDKRAKLFAVNSVLPLIARLRKAIETKDNAYAQELLSQIEQYNDLLTEWIRLEQGKLSLKIETFPISDLLKILKRNEKTFAMQGITLKVEDCDLKVKADKVLTLFMLNTLADNARKTTPAGGMVKISARLLSLGEPDIYSHGENLLSHGELVEHGENNNLVNKEEIKIPQFPQVPHEKKNQIPHEKNIQIPQEKNIPQAIEIEVSDTGTGMTEEQAANIFTHQITDGHGFGLLNCRGIINSYKKAGSLFNCCMIGVESKLGKGSRFFFRLPTVPHPRPLSPRRERGDKLFLSLLVFLMSGFNLCLAQDIYPPSPSLGRGAGGEGPLGREAGGEGPRPTRYTEQIPDPILRQAADYADSAYYSNIDGNYEQTLLYADSVRCCLTQTDSDPLLSDDITADVSNEAAVAALALHRWEDYRSYNSIYETVFERLTSNRQLEEYCERQSEFLSHIRKAWRLSNMIALDILVLAWLFIRLLWVRRKRMLRYRDELGIDEKRSLVRQLEYENESLHIANNILTNGLSTIKHETMYYPSRIKALLDKSSGDSLELVGFYEQLYNNLSQQLSKQKLASGIKLTRFAPTAGANDIRPSIKADKDLYAYLLLLIKRYLGVRKLDTSIQSNGQYTDIIISTPTKLDKDCFAPTTRNIPMLVARQIMRDMSAPTSRGSGIITGENTVTLRFG